MAKMHWRYVEMAYNLPDVVEAQFRATALRAGSPDLAAKTARNELLGIHPDATNITEFMQRTITKKRADEIRVEFAARTWSGWPFTRETA